MRLVGDHDPVRLALPFAEPYDPGIFADPQEHVGPGGRQLAKMLARRLVGAMFAPLGIEGEQLRIGRQPSEVLGDAPQLVVGEREPEAAAARDSVVERGRRLRHALHRVEAAAAGR